MNLVSTNRAIRLLFSTSVRAISKCQADLHSKEEIRLPISSPMEAIRQRREKGSVLEADTAVLAPDREPAFCRIKARSQFSTNRAIWATSERPEDTYLLCGDSPQRCGAMCGLRKSMSATKSLGIESKLKDSIANEKANAKSKSMFQLHTYFILVSLSESDFTLTGLQARIDKHQLTGNGCSHMALDKETRES